MQNTPEKEFANFIKKILQMETKRHHLAEGVARSTIYDAIQRVKSGIGAIRRVGSGRIAVKMPKEKVARLARQFNHKDGKSQKAAGREYGIDQSYVCKLLKDLKIKCRTKKTIPDRTLEQAVAAKTVPNPYRKI